MNHKENETRLNALKHAPNEASQKSLAQTLGFSVGKTNYILKGLVEKGFIKAERFINSDNKAGYRYVLTPKGIKERIRLTEAFIQRRKHKYEELQKDLKALKEHDRSVL